MSWRGMLGVTLALAVPLAPAFASEPKAAEPTMAERLGAMRERDQRILDIGWKLATANAPYCENVVPAIGLMLLDTGSFADPDAAGDALGARGIVVQAAASGSPAERAGWAFPAHIASIDGLPVATSPNGAAKWEKLVAVNRTISESLGDDGAVELGATDSGKRSGDDARTTRIEGTASCNAVMEPRDGEDRARATGNRILIGASFAGFAYEEDEFAAAIAHEMAHIVLGHLPWLDANGRSNRNIRRTEREADRLAPWLLANAGYNPFAAERFMRRWGPDHDGGLFRKRTHDGWDERAQTIAGEAAFVDAAMMETGAADWKTRFAREFTR